MKALRDCLLRHIQSAHIQYRTSHAKWFCFIEQMISRKQIRDLLPSIAKKEIKPALLIINSILVAVEITISSLEYRQNLILHTYSAFQAICKHATF